jgi:hypothetical protein
LTPTETEAMAAARVRLRRNIDQWREYQLQHYPQLRPQIKPGDLGKPEDDALVLPSTFPRTMRARLNLGELATIEYNLREGQAHDALRDLRLAIKTFNYNLSLKKINIHGQSANTRAQAFLQSLSADKINAAEKYRCACTALRALGLSEDDTMFRELRDDELWMKNVSSTHALGDGGKPDPWFWALGRPSGMSAAEDKEWSRERMNFPCLFKNLWLMLFALSVDRVKWFRDRADRDRWKEEVEILDAEFQRTLVSRARMSQTWSELASKNMAQPGAAAYAYRQSSMYRALADECAKLYQEAKAINTTKDLTHVSCHPAFFESGF